MSQVAQSSAYFDAQALAIVRWIERLFCSKQLFSRPFRKPPVPKHLKRHFVSHMTFFFRQAVCTARSCKHTYIEGRHASQQRNEHQLGREKTASVLHTCSTFECEGLGFSCAATNMNAWSVTVGNLHKLWTL